MVKIKPELRFSFPAVLAVILSTDTEGTALLCLLACGLHELGHIIVMLIEGRPPERIIFYGGGIKLSGNKSNSIPAIISGCLVNFTLFGIFYFFGGNYTLKLFGMINFLTGFFNLMPIQPLDGYYLLEKAVIRLFPAERIAAVIKFVEIAASVIFAPMIIALFLHGEMNFSSVIFLFYLLVVDIIENL